VVELLGVIGSSFVPVSKGIMKEEEVRSRTAALGSHIEVITWAHNDQSRQLQTIEAPDIDK